MNVRSTISGVIHKFNPSKGSSTSSNINPNGTLKIPAKINMQWNKYNEQLIEGFYKKTPEVSIGIPTEVQKYNFETQDHSRAAASKIFKEINKNSTFQTKGYEFKCGFIRRNLIVLTDKLGMGKLFIRLVRGMIHKSAGCEETPVFFSNLTELPEDEGLSSNAKNAFHLYDEDEHSDLYALQDLFLKHSKNMSELSNSPRSLPDVDITKLF